MDEQDLIQRIKARRPLREFTGERDVADAIEEARARYGAGEREMAFTLFELNVLAGRLDEADAVIAEFQEAAPPLAKTCQLYRDLLVAEKWRHEWRRDGERVPAAFSAPPDGLKLRCRAYNEYHQKSARHALETLSRAEKRRKATSGVLLSVRQDTHRFDDIRDSDCFLSDCLEVLTPKRFFLLPFAEIRQIELPHSETLRQAVFVLAQLATFSKVQGLVWIPQFYAGTHLSEEAESRQGAVTTWDDLDDHHSIAYGPRKLQVVCDESLYLFGLDDIVRIAFSPRPAK